MRTAVITGGASGIGLGIARALAKDGARLMIGDIDAERLKNAARDLKKMGAELYAKRCDVTEAADIDRLAACAWDKLGRVDLFFNNAGVMPKLVPFLDMDLADAEWVIDVNLRAVMRALQVFARRLVMQETESRIVVTGSEHSTGTPHVMGAAYTASKHGVLGLCDVVRRELPAHVGLSVLMPGIVRTGLAGALAHRHERYGGPIPSRRGARIDMGPDADAVGAFAVKRVLEGEDMIVTHPHIACIISDRYNLLSEAAARPMSLEDPHALDMRGAVGELFDQYVKRTEDSVP